MHFGTARTQMERERDNMHRSIGTQVRFARAYECIVWTNFDFGSSGDKKSMCVIWLECFHRGTPPRMFSACAVCTVKVTHVFRTLI